MKLVSWNLLRLTGASLHDVVRLIEDEQPDLLLMQEVTAALDRLADRVGGTYFHSLMPKRIHGLGAWVPAAFTAVPRAVPLASGVMFDRVCQIVETGSVTVANVHLSHGQVLNRRQLRQIAKLLPHRALIVGDYNLVGPPFVPGFRDVGPRKATHRAADLLPLRLDRCLARGVACLHAQALAHGPSDHRPIVMTLDDAPAMALA